MGKVLPFGRKPAQKRNLLCMNNHHKWEVVKDRRFDVRKGKLLTDERCSRCGKTRSRLL